MKIFPGLQFVVELANEKQKPESLTCLSNEFGFGAASELVVPYGDHPHPRGIQRVTRESADRLAARWNSIKSKVGRFFGGVPVYIGHPDVAEMANAYPDKRAYGWIVGIEPRESEMALLVEWNDAGKELVNTKAFKFHSPRMFGAKVGTERNRDVFEWVELASAGLTNNPNIRGSAIGMANEDLDEEDEQKETKETDMLLQFMRKLFGMDEMTEEQATVAIGELKKKADGVAEKETAMANERTTFETLKTELTNTRDTLKSDLEGRTKAHAALLLDIAVKEARITHAERAAFETEFANDFTAAETRLASMKPALKVAGTTDDAAKRTGAAVDPASQYLSLVNERVEKTGRPFITVWEETKKDAQGKALWDLMQQKPAAN